MELSAALEAMTARAERAEADLAKARAATVGIMTTLQAAQERTVNLLVGERQANLYTEHEAHAILGAFALCFSEGTSHATSDGAKAAERSVVEAMRAQQPDVFAQYAYAFPWAIEA